jgi:hypothetical protein
MHDSRYKSFNHEMSLRTYYYSVCGEAVERGRVCVFASLPGWLHAPHRGKLDASVCVAIADPFRRRALNKQPKKPTSATNLSLTIR